MKEKPNYKIYLGDSVYAQVTGDLIELFLDNGHGPHNILFLEPEVFSNLLIWIEETDCPVLDVFRHYIQGIAKINETKENNETK